MDANAIADLIYETTLWGLGQEQIQAGIRRPRRMMNAGKFIDALANALALGQMEWVTASGVIVTEESKIPARWTFTPADFDRKEFLRRAYGLPEPTPKLREVSEELADYDSGSACGPCNDAKDD